MKKDLFNLKCKLCLVVVLAMFSAHASTAVLELGIYRLGDHPDGDITDKEGPYGLRLDDLLPPKGDGPTFSTVLYGAETWLEWDGGTTASIFGTLWNNTLGELWRVEHVFTGVTTSLEGFTATGGTLSLTDASNNTLLFDSKADASGSVFIADGSNHRCDGYDDCGPYVGTGWIMPLDIDKKGKTNDWLVTLTPVPAPLAGILFASALGFLSLLRKRANQ